MEDVTLFLTACGRPDLLRITLETFVKFNTYPIKEGIIIEDSGQTGINDFAYDIVNFPLKIIYNQTRLGQMKSIEKGYPLIITDYVFHCEEDWEFYDYSFIEESLKILKIDSNITSVQLRSHLEIMYKYNTELIEKDNYYITKAHVHEDWDPPQAGMVLTFNPGLRTKEVCMEKIPYDNNDYIHIEGTLSYYLYKKGMYSVLTPKRDGYVKHIGDNHHVY